ncbi:hypothetical protein PSU4_57400 [Pseudonocardia sulfidoxydans NBRC 16205]|uniref:Uncharacterized protein n=1 Tax=Pseudonocardia sulfidoxydans NBRC 16205 TaxID=1223511 RepID=A0A511DPP1_9PSEU|nr:hypothetical protein PSU4_57400 [Pseudonocardia sulfidoxydans NBRC 16205]
MFRSHTAASLGARVNPAIYAQQTSDAGLAKQLALLVAGLVALVVGAVLTSVLTIVVGVLLCLTGLARSILADRTAQRS